MSALQLISAFAPKTGRRHTVRIDGFDSKDAIFDRTEVEEIHLHPVMAGAGHGLGQIILGAVLIVVGIVIESPTLIQAGVMLVLGGILQMIAPQPKKDDPNDQTRYLGQGKNTVAIGTRIPMIYGRFKAYGQYLSFAVESDDLNTAPADWYASTFTTYGDLTFAAAPPVIPLDPPSIYDGQPKSYFLNLSYPADITATPEVHVNFSPALDLDAGAWDITFENGRTLHVNNLAGGSTTRVTILGGDYSNLPATGTPIIFTQNYG